MILKNYFKFSSSKKAFFYFKKGSNFYDWKLIKIPFTKKNRKIFMLNKNKPLLDYCTAT